MTIHILKGVFIYIYVYVYVCNNVCICIHIYMQGGRHSVYLYGHIEHIYFIIYIELCFTMNVKDRIVIKII